MFNVVLGLIDRFAIWMRQMLVWPGGLHKAQISLCLINEYECLEILSDRTSG